MVEAGGKVLVRLGTELHDPVTGDVALPDPLHSFGLTGPFRVAGESGPDLIQPRPHLRIVPGKVAGEPHVEGTRITTAALASLVAEGYRPLDVAEMYAIPPEAVEEAESLEKQLGNFLQAA